mmetsp:Transcript_38766/g.51079  ORF Transcript_38766/g.51079 Transcript_38766/m.51079 type:complete len:264 (+) Transcript_38766:113-904(+)
MSRNLSATQKQRVKQLCTFTGASSSQAVTLLQHSNWSVEAAADAFFTYGFQLDGGAPAAPAVPQVDTTAINNWFNRYQDEDDPDTITDDGITRFCEELGIDTQDVVVLVISWKMQASTMCVYTREEWQRGMSAMGVDSLEALQKILSDLRDEINGSSFKDFYMFCYNFGKEEGKKSLSLDMALALWELLLAPRNFPLYPEWMVYIKTQEAQYPFLPKDTWSLLLDFFNQVDRELNGYDEADAWPVVIDDFVTHMQSLNSESKK